VTTLKPAIAADTPDTPPPGEPVRGTSSAVLLVLCLTQFMLILDLSVVSVALPSIQDGLGFKGSDLQWVISAYAITFGGLLMFAGRVGDLFGRRRFFVIGIAVFGAASAACGAATGPTLLIIARAMQGIGAAIASPAALSLLTTSYEEGPARNKALGAWGAVAAGGAAAGVLLGGILTDTLGWRWVFLINVPIALAIIATTPRLIAPSIPIQRQPIDIIGALSITTAVAALVFGLSRIEATGIGSATVIVSLTIAAFALALFIATELKVATPLVRLSIFRSRQLTAANIVEMLVSAAIIGQAYFGSLYLQRVLGFSAIRTGLAFLPNTLVIMISATVVPKILTRTGVKSIVLAGTLGLAAAQGLLARLPVNGSYLRDFLPGLVIFGLALGATFTGALVGATTGVNEHDQGLASGIVNTAEQIGSSLGIAILASVAASRTGTAIANCNTDRAALNAGYGRAFAVASGLALAAFLLALVLYPNHRKPKAATP
jgi:EmrB/QacA subfamily drug resistance transporter